MCVDPFDAFMVSLGWTGFAIILFMLAVKFYKN